MVARCRVMPSESPRATCPSTRNGGESVRSFGESSAVRARNRRRLTASIDKTTPSRDTPTRRQRASHHLPSRQRHSWSRACCLPMRQYGRSGLRDHPGGSTYVDPHLHVPTVIALAIRSVLTARPSTRITDVRRMVCHDRREIDRPQHVRTPRCAHLLCHSAWGRGRIVWLKRRKRWHREPPTHTHVHAQDRRGRLLNRRRWRAPHDLAPSEPRLLSL
jgi:hypothetical protein